MPIDRLIKMLEKATIYNPDLEEAHISPVAHERLQIITDFMALKANEIAKNLRRKKRYDNLQINE